MTKKVMPIVLSILSIIFLMGCGSSPEVSDIEANQVEEAPISEEKEDTQTEPFEEEMAATAENSEESDTIRLDYFYDDSMTLVYAEFRLEDENLLFTSGDIINAAPKSFPRYYAGHDDKTVVTCSGVESSLIKNYFDYGYRFYIADKEQPVHDAYEELLQESTGKSEDDKSAVSAIDITGKMPKSLSFVRNDDGAITQLQVVKAEAIIENVEDSKVLGPTVVFTLPEGALDDVYVYMNELFYGIKSESDTVKPPDNGSDHSSYKISEVAGKWYPERSDFTEYYIQFDKDGTGSIRRDDEVFSITYTFDGHLLHMKDELGGSRDFYYENGELISDVDGDIYKREKAENTIEDLSGFDITGTWYDPTGLSMGGFTFNGDGTGIYDFGGNSGTREMTYSISGNTVSYQLPRSSGKLTIKDGKLYDGESTYIKR